VGLLAIALRDLGSGLCPIGFGKTRGLGRVTVTLEELEVAYPGRFEAQKNDRHYAHALYPIGAFHPEWCAGTSYGVEEETAIELADLNPTLSDDGALGRVAFKLIADDPIRSAMKRAAGAWKAFALARCRGGAT
jgi:hypothetical protein